MGGGVCGHGAPSRRTIPPHPQKGLQDTALDHTPPPFNQHLTVTVVTVVVTAIVTVDTLAPARSGFVAVSAARL